MLRVPSILRGERKEKKSKVDVRKRIQKERKDVRERQKQRGSEWQEKRRERKDGEKWVQAQGSPRTSQLTPNSSHP